MQRCSLLSVSLSLACCPTRCAFVLVARPRVSSRRCLLRATSVNASSFAPRARDRCNLQFATRSLACNRIATRSRANMAVFKYLGEQYISKGGHSSGDGPIMSISSFQAGDQKQEVIQPRARVHASTTQCCAVLTLCWTLRAIVRLLFSLLPANSISNWFLRALNRDTVSLCAVLLYWLSCGTTLHCGYLRSCAVDAAAHSLMSCSPLTELTACSHFAGF